MAQGQRGGLLTNVWRRSFSTGGVVGLFVLAFIPFLGRPFFFDDGSVVVSALAARAHPLSPHNFSLDLDVPDLVNWPAGGLPAYTHPPFTAWFLGATAALFGASEVPFHAAMGLAAALALLLAARLARMFTAKSAAALFLYAFSPIFFLTSLTLYPHLLYFLFYVAALYALRRVCDAPGVRWPLFFGGALTLAALSLHQWPVLLVVCVLFFALGPRRPGAWRGILVGLVVFAALYGGWCAWEITLHGMSHFGATYRVRAAGQGYLWSTAFLPSAFLGAGVPAAGFGLLFLWHRRRRVAWGLLGLGLCLFVFLAGPRGGFSVVQAGLLAVFFLAGLGLPAALAGRPGLTASDRLLAGWFLVELFFVQRYLTLPSGHHLLPLAFAAVLLVVRLFELHPWPRRFLPAAGAASLLLTLALAQADYALSAVGPKAAADIPVPRPGRSFYWGTAFGPVEYHFKKAGWLPLDPRRLLRPGDCALVYRRMAGMPAPAFLRDPAVGIAGRWTYRVLNPLRTLSLPAAAGWYSASWGALPYSFSLEPAEEFVLLCRGEAP